MSSMPRLLAPSISMVPSGCARTLNTHPGTADWPAFDPVTTHGLAELYATLTALPGAVVKTEYSVPREA